MRVFTMVTLAIWLSARPSSTVSLALSAVEKVTPCRAMMVPFMKPPAALMVAAEPTCQNTFS